MRRIRPGLRSPETPHRSAGLGGFLAITLAGFAACTTEDPREVFRVADSARAPGAGGRASATAGNTATSGRPSQAGTRGMPQAGGTAAGGSGARTGSGTPGGEGGESGAGASDSGGSNAGSTNASGGSGAVTAAGGAGASDSGGSGGSAGAGPADSCGDRPVTSEPFTKRALRVAAADCAVWHYCKFEAEASRLEQSIQASVEAPTPENLETARNRWQGAMSAWSAVELFQFGPLSSRAESEGKDLVYGQGLREFIYAWPRFTRCRVEEQVASRVYQTQGFENVPISSRGLFGLEYLLFYAGSDTGCAAGTATANTWATLDAGELAERKQSYLGALATDVVTTTRRLLELWSPSGGNFRETFINATGYADEQEALTILAWSLVYVEREVKDWKLGVPLGVTLLHSVNGPEAPFARTGTQNIAQNLRGFRALFQGCGAAGEGLGFDDWLSEAGHPELAADILGALDAADAYTRTFPALDTATPEQLETFYRTIKSLTDYLKSDLFGTGSPLNLKLPKGVEGDTD